MVLTCDSTCALTHNMSQSCSRHFTSSSSKNIWESQGIVAAVPASISHFCECLHSAAEGRACKYDLLRFFDIRRINLRACQREASDERCLSYLQETHLAKAAFDTCHSKTHASLTVCGDPQCKKRSSYFCSGCQMAFCKYSGAKCWGKAHTNLYFDFLKTAEANARENFKELKKKSK